MLASEYGAKSVTTESEAVWAADLSPTAGWSRRVRHVGGLIQTAFAAVWLIRGSHAIVATMSGTALIATTGIAAGVLLLATAVAGFGDLAGVRRTSQQAAAAALAVAGRAGAQP